MKFKPLLIAALVATLSLSALAGEKEVKDSLSKQFPKLNIEAVTFLPDVNLYEVLTVNDQSQKVPLYTNEKIDFLMLTTGELLSTKTKKNVTIERDIDRTKASFKALPFKDGFSVKYGKGTRSIAIFSDPDCPFCQELEKDFAKNMKQDITVHYFMNPLTSLHPNAAARAQRILCDKDPAKAWVNYTTNAPGLDRAAAQSFNPESFLPKNDGSCARGKQVQAQYDLSSKFGFNSTPTIMFDNGYIVRDRLSPAQVQTVLDKRK